MFFLRLHFFLICSNPEYKTVKNIIILYWQSESYAGLTCAGPSAPASFKLCRQRYVPVLHKAETDYRRSGKNILKQGEKHGTVIFIS